MLGLNCEKPVNPQIVQIFSIFSLCRGGSPKKFDFSKKSNFFAPRSCSALGILALLVRLKLGSPLLFRQQWPGACPFNPLQRVSHTRLSRSLPVWGSTVNRDKIG
jgi:hypothetical protein